MVKIQVEKNRRRSIFYKAIMDEEGKVSSERKVLFPLYKVPVGDFPFFVLYDDDMNVVSPVFQFLNFKMRESPFNSRKKAAQAIRLLYCFLSLSMHSIHDLDERAILELRSFVRGVSIFPMDNDSHAPLRNNSTVNEYFSFYREFFKFADIHNESLFRSHIVNNYAQSDLPASPNQIRYDNNMKTHDDSNKVPPFISPDEFRIIYTEMLNAKDLQACIIVKLMYIYGLRLGEVLGLTVEDIREIKIGGKLQPVIILRNRMSDASFQSAKGLPVVNDRREYSTKDYKSQSEQIVLVYPFYEEILEFVGQQHEELSRKYPENYETGVADIVSSDYPQETNHYLFLNRYGRVLSGQTWNLKLRHYFEIVGIPIDHGVRENNLSHRFRHGFAMFHAHFSEHPVKSLMLQKMMRHKVFTSTMRYYNPTKEQELEEKMAFQKDLYDLMPELKEGLPFEASENS